MKQGTTITKKSILVLTGIAITGIAYTPAVKHHKPNADIIVSYLSGHKYYNPYKNEKDWQRSENRKKQILDNINNIREQIRTLAAKQKQTTDPAAKLIETIASTMMSNTRAREHQLRTSRAATLRTLPKFINYQNLCKKCSIVEIEFV